AVKTAVGADHSLKPLRHLRSNIWWYGDTQHPGGVDVNQEYEFTWLFNWQLGGSGATQDFVNIRGTAPVDGAAVCGVRQQSARGHVPPGSGEGTGQMILQRQLHDASDRRKQ